MDNAFWQKYRDPVSFGGTSSSIHSTLKTKDI